MKKFYLFSMLFMALAITTVAQDCPSPMPVARNYPNPTANPPYCMVVYTGGFTPGQLYLKVGSSLIPKWGTGPGTGNAAVYAVDVQADGSANFVYDCNTYGNATSALLVQVVSGQIVKTCEVTVIQQAPLPVKLTSFTGRLTTESTVTLDWTSIIEWNSYEYQVERSADGRNFEKVGDIKAAGSSNEEVKYKLTDQLPAAGSYFYRLKQIDIDNKFEYSKVVYVNSKKGAGIVTKIFPNPFNNEVQLIGATSADLNTQGAIKVFSMSGQMINFKVVGANAISIDPAAPKGMYLLKFRNNNSEQTFKLVKQ